MNFIRLKSIEGFDKIINVNDISSVNIKPHLTKGQYKILFNMIHRSSSVPIIIDQECYDRLINYFLETNL